MEKMPTMLPEGPPVSESDPAYEVISKLWHLGLENEEALDALIEWQTTRQERAEQSAESPERETIIVQIEKARILALSGHRREALDELNEIFGQTTPTSNTEDLLDEVAQRMYGLEDDLEGKFN